MPDDAAALAELINIAGEGLPLHVWRSMAAPGEDAWAVGRQRARREQGAFSYRNAFVAEADGRVVSCLIGYPLPEAPEPIDYAQIPALFAPLQELENLAPGTWYVNVLATYPEHRGAGYGSRLLALADEIAAASSSHGSSIIVADANVGARRLYLRCGYHERAMRPVVREENWETPARNWLLLVKPRAEPEDGT
jgi:ribosomal protein S18 acetylase RimI-like enzyme